MDRPDTSDVLFVREPSLLGRVTDWFEREPASHQATGYDQSFLVEALPYPHQVSQTPWPMKFKQMADDNAEWILFRFTPPIGEITRAQVKTALDEFINHHLLRRGRRGYDVYVFRRLGNLWKNGVICSKTSNRALIKAGLLPKSETEFASPGDTYRFLLQSDRAQILGHSTGWFNVLSARLIPMTRRLAANDPMTNDLPVFNRDQVFGQARQILTLLGAWLVTRGKLTQADVEPLTGLALILLSSLWSFLSHRYPKVFTAPRSIPAKQAT